MFEGRGPTEACWPLRNGLWSQKVRLSSIKLLTFNSYASLIFLDFSSHFITFLFQKQWFATSSVVASFTSSSVSIGRLTVVIVCAGRSKFGAYEGGGGQEKCITCTGSGRVTCKKCKGACELLHFVNVEFNFVTKSRSFIHETTDLPDSLVGKVESDQIFKDIGRQVPAIENFEVEDIVIASEQFLSEQLKQAKQGRLICQEQKLLQIPVCEVNYQYKDELYQVFVYGKNHRVYFDDEYPMQCCCF